MAKAADAKLQRWIDLLAALLNRRYGATFSELKGLVPAYGAAKDPKTLERMFERDKDELRGLGLPIDVQDEETEDGVTARYSMRARETYMPFLTLAAGSARRSAPPAGYRDIPALAFEPDELALLVRATSAAKSVGDPDLARDADAVLHKLTFDLGLPVGAAIDASDQQTTRPSEPQAAPAVSTLGEALLRRKRVTFDYHSINRDVTDAREVEPYGIAFSSGHWYLVGRDVGADALRKFRVSRMSRVLANDKKPQSSDYEVPADFTLAAHARTKGAWELGEDAAEDMVVEIRGESGVAASVATLGVAVDGHPARRRFGVRRVDSFVRWMMSFAGDVVPVSPPSLVERYRATLSSTLGVYERGDA